MHRRRNDCADPASHEAVQHGTTAMPVASYYDDLNENCCPWHWHEELEAGIITEGVPLISAGTQSWQIPPGDGFFVNTGVLHSGQTVRPEDMPGSGGCRLHSLVFHDRLIGGSRESIFHLKYVYPVLGNSALEGYHLRASVPWESAALERIETAYQACQSKEEDYELIVRGALSEFMSLLVRNLPLEQAPPDAKAMRDAERIKLMLLFIEEHYAEELTTSAIAQSAAVSESECLRCFRATIGTTPIRYLREYRIDSAAQLLASGRMRPSEAAARCGFQDVSYFDRTFRQLRGCTPGEYVRRLSEDG